MRRSARLLIPMLALAAAAISGCAATPAAETADATSGTAIPVRVMFNSSYRYTIASGDPLAMALLELSHIPNTTVVDSQTDDLFLLEELDR